jgi:uncharacterized protein YraI
MSVWRKTSTPTKLVLILLIIILAALIVLVLVRTGVIPGGGSLTNPEDEGSNLELIVPTPVPGSALVMAKTNVHIRRGPGDDYESYGLLAEGKIAQAIGVSVDNLWWAINVPTVESMRGWVSAEYVEAENTDGLPIIEEDEASADSTPEPIIPIVIATTNTDIHSGPGVDFYIYGILEVAQSARVLGVSRDGLWWQINVPFDEEVQGWVVADAVVAQNVSSVPVIDTQATPDPGATLTPSGATATAITNVNIRNGPGTDYQKIGLFELNQTAGVVGVSNDGQWWLITLAGLEGGEGWVSAQYVIAENTIDVPVVSAEGERIANQMVIPTPGVGDAGIRANVVVNIRSGPGIENEILGRLNAGQQATVIGINTDSSWWVISVPSAVGGRGWVSADYVTAENTVGVPIIE